MKKIVFLLLLGICHSINGARAEIPQAFFDELVTKDFLAFGLETPVAFEYGIKTENNIRIYAGTTVFSEADSGNYYHFGIGVATAPALLDEIAYCNGKRRLLRESGGQAEQLVQHAFPPLGCRAQREFYGAGPGGSGYALVFTTSDCRYDVRVFVGMDLSGQTTDPAFDIDKIAYALSARYDRELARRGGQTETFACPPPSVP